MTITITLITLIQMTVLVTNVLKVIGYIMASVIKMTSQDIFLVTVLLLLVLTVLRLLISKLITVSCVLSCLVSHKQ